MLRKRQVYSQRTSKWHKNKIIDTLYLAWLIFGAVGITISFFRGIYFSQLYYATGINMASNISFFALTALIFLFRGYINRYVKTSILLIIFGIVAVSFFFYYGTSFLGLIMLCICVFLITITFSTKTSSVLIAAISLIIPIMGMLFISKSIQPYVDLNEIQFSYLHWFFAYVIFGMFALSTIIGVNLYNNVLEKTIGDLDEGKRNLENIIAKMNKEAQKKAVYKRELELSEIKWKGIIDASSDAMFMLDAKANVLESNHAVEILTGYDQQEINKIGLFNIVAPNHRREVQDRFFKLLKGDLVPNSEFDIITKDRKVIQVEHSSNLIIAEEHLMVVAFIRDISFRKIHENEKLNAVLRAEEEERGRLSKDIHDDLGPSFSSIKLYLQSFRKSESDFQKKETLSQIIDMVDSSVKQIREISHNLSPYLLNDKGLFEAVKFHLHKVKSTNSLKTKLIIYDVHPYSLEKSKEILIYRSFLELFSNSLKHANATEVIIEFVYDGQVFIMNYIDNGIGFDPNNLKHPHSGIGLKNITSRIQAAGGEINFERDQQQMKIILLLPV